MQILPQCADGLPNICGSEKLIEDVISNSRARRSTDPAKYRSRSKIDSK
jgi:hypothetical protein